jgi:hypothetical protein
MSERRKVRKAIPDRVKLIAALRRFGLVIEQVQFDHFPALELRPINPHTGETIPPANDPEHIQMLLITEHKVKTFGPGGEKRITTAGSDIGNIAKTRRLTKAQEESRRRMLAKAEGEDGETTKRKTKWPKRSFPKKP